MMCTCPGRFPLQWRLFRSNPAAGVVYGDALAIDAEGRSFNLMRARQYSLLDLMAFNIICQPAAFMRRSVLEQVDYLNLDYHLLMDNLLWINMARLPRLYMCRKSGRAARYHDQAKNRTGGAAYGREAKMLVEDLKTRPEFSGIIKANEKRIMAGVNRFDAFYLTDAGQPREALRAYGRAFRLHPTTALGDWKHILLAFFSLLGLQKGPFPVRSCSFTRLEPGEIRNANSQVDFLVNRNFAGPGGYLLHPPGLTSLRDLKTVCRFTHEGWKL